jgi:sensor histidine kinase YesM
VFGFWLFLAALESLRLIFDPVRQFGSIEMYILDGIVENLIWALTTLGLFRLMDRRPLEQGVNISRYLLYTVIGLTVSIIVEMIQFASIFVLIQRGDIPIPVDPEGAGPQLTLLTPILSLWFLDEIIVYLGILGVAFARRYLVRLREREWESARLQAEAANLEAQLADAHLAALRMQLNPHFLFNTLHTVSSLADDDPEGVQRVVARLSGLLRHVLEGSSRQEVPLRGELAFVRDYLEIHRIRFQGSLDINEELDPDTLDALVPNLILQPLVENAIKHGVGQNEEGARISLRSYRETASGLLVLSIEDNGPGLTPGAELKASQAGRVGIANTRERLRALYGSAASLELAESEGGGVAAILSLPYYIISDLRSIPHESSA